MATREEIQDHIATMLNAIDRLDWSAVRAAFAPTVTIDYTSLFGGSAEKLKGTSACPRSRGPEWRRGSCGIDDAYDRH
jgi:hypothetical protein